MLLDLFLGFLRVGCFSFGGGYAAVALIREIVQTNGWLSEEMLSYIIAVSESTPGPIMVNLATYVGSTQAGVLGAIVATFAVALPAFLIILGLMAVMKRFMGNPWVSAAMKGLKACIIGVIFATGLEMLWTNCVSMKTPDLTAIGLTALLAGVYFGARTIMHRKISPIALIGISALLGVAAYGV